MNTAAKVAEDKRQHPERFCPAPRCLWHTAKLNHATGERECGGYCPRHNGAGRVIVAATRPSPGHPEVGDPATHNVVLSARQVQPAPPIQQEPKRTSTVIEWIRNGFRFPEKAQP
jgi:hypothetical protein